MTTDVLLGLLVVFQAATAAGVWAAYLKREWNVVRLMKRILTEIEESQTRGKL